jgi:putative FmdB family regulatory protein
MPKYSFECQNLDCGLQFERILKMGDNLLHPCPACGEDAPQVIDGGFGFSFDVSPHKEGNSGVHKDDYPTADRAVGRDAERRWEVIDKRNKVKAQIRANSGTGALIRKDEPGGKTSYAVLSPEQQVARQDTARRAGRALEVARNSRQGAR